MALMDSHKKSHNARAFVIGAFLLGGILFAAASTSTDLCTVVREAREVRGQSLAGVLAEGTGVVLTRNYYACHEPKRFEIVAYQAPGFIDPVVKVVRGLPGDTFDVMSEPAGNELFINGEVVQTSDKHPYLLSENRLHFWQLYKKQFKGVIPGGQYILLGNIPGGSVDSILFGFVAKEQLLGRIER